MTTSTIQPLNGTLTMNDLPHLLNLLSCVKHKCKYIGLQLGVDNREIQSITTQHTQHLDQLWEILQYRLNQPPPLTVQDIIQALKSDSVKENLLASEIETQCAHQGLALASSQVGTKPPPPPSSTTTQSTLNIVHGPPTGAVASGIPPSRSERELMASFTSRSPHTAYFPAWTYYQASNQGLDTLTSTTNQDYTMNDPPPVPMHMNMPYPAAWLSRKTYNPLQQPHLYNQNIPASTNPVSLVDTNLANTTPSPLHPNFFLGSDTPLHVGQTLINPHGMTPPHHLHQTNQQQAGHISDYTSMTQSTDRSNDCSTALASTAVDQFIEYIKTTYRQSMIERDLNVIKWPPTPSKIFINLALIDWKTVVTRKEFTRAMVEDGNVDVIMKKKTSIEFSDIVQDLPHNALKIVLVVGAPGVGKSTFAWEFCRRWERREIAQQYQLVLLLRLRDEEMTKAQSLRDLLCHPESRVRDAMKEDLIKTYGDKCLIILEGFDELPDTSRMESSIFLKLLKGKILPLATILVTSRPWATSILLDMCHHNIFRHIEILGFTESKIKEYVRSVFEDEEKSENGMIKEKHTGNMKKEKDIKETMTYIATYPQIKACMYIPLNSAIVVSVYQESKAGRCILPKTLTELYYALIQILLLRYLRGHPVHKNIRKIESLEKDLPQEVYKQLLKISVIAYTGICTDCGNSVKLIYSNLPPTFEALGLMQSVPQMYITGMSVSHSFLHLTVQEFLAALHISNMSPEKQLEHFKRHQDGRFRVVLRFLAGFTKLHKIPLEQKRRLLEPPRHHGNDVHVEYSQMRSNVSVGVHHLNWMFETQSSDTIKPWLEDKTVDFEFQRQMSPLEYYSAGYCITHSNSNWILIIQEDMEEDNVKMFCTGTSFMEEADFKMSLRIFVPMAAEMLNELLTSLDSHIVELHLMICRSNFSLKPLSRLQVLHIRMHSMSLNFPAPISSQSLESLTVEAGSGSNVLELKSCSAIGEILSSTKLLKRLQSNFR